MFAYPVHMSGVTSSPDFFFGPFTKVKKSMSTKMKDRNGFKTSDTQAKA